MPNLVVYRLYTLRIGVLDARSKPIHHFIGPIRLPAQAKFQSFVQVWWLVQTESPFQTDNIQQHIDSQRLVPVLPDVWWFKTKSLSQIENT